MIRLQGQPFSLFIGYGQFLLMQLRKLHVAKYLNKVVI